MELEEKVVNEEELERLVEDKGSEELYRLASRIRHRARLRREQERREESRRRREEKKESRRRKVARGEAPEGRWLIAMYTNCGQCARCRAAKEAYARGEGELEKFHGPYWYLKTYQPVGDPYTDEAGHLRYGRIRTRYVGRRLPADLAGELGYREGDTPEEAGVSIH